MSQTQTRRSSQVDLLHGPILKSLLLFALPIMASRVFQQIYNTMDTLIVGYTLGDSSIAAMGACSSIYEMMTGFTFGVGNGLAIVTARCFGRQLTRVRTLDDSRQEFVSNVSHELKTPLASMKVLADSLNGQEGVPVELYQEFMQDITSEIDRENQIITDLLSLVKMDKKVADLNITQVNINELLEQLLKRLHPIAAQKNVELILDSFRPVNAEVDATKLSLAFSNLIENGIKYNNENGWVRVSLNADHKYFYVTVADSGIGIPEESIAHIFERFYRVDKSHSREIGGTGLGLAIARSAIVMHRGAIRVYSKENEGTTFSVRIPLNYVM